MDVGWLGWALLTTAAWGVGTLAAKPATDRLGPRVLFLGVVGTEGATFAVLGLLLERPAFDATPAIVAIALVAGTMGMLGYLMFYEGLRWGSVGLVGTVTAAYPVVTVGLSVAFLRETLSVAQAAGVALMILCVVLLALEPGARDGTRRAAVVLSVVGFLAWGLWGFLAKVSVGAMGEPNLFLFYAIADVFVFGAYFALRKFPRPAAGGDPRRTRTLALVAIVGGAAGVFFVTFGYGSGPASLVTSVSGSYPIVSTLGAAALLRERLNARIAAALLCFAAGILLIAF